MCSTCYVLQGRKSFRGISASSLLFQLARSSVLLLYLHDQGTSWLVLLGILKVRIGAQHTAHSTQTSCS